LRRRPALIWIFVVALVPTLSLAQNLPANPQLAGFTLGSTQQQVVSALGRPDTILDADSLNFRVLQYPARGVSFMVYKPTAVVTVITVVSPNADSLAGIAIGSPHTELITRWGTPIHAEGTRLRYGSNSWMLIVDLTEPQTTIRRISLTKVYAFQY